MPVYEYECAKCGEKFELRRSINDSDNNIMCPKCNQPSPKRVFSVFNSNSNSSNCAPSATSGSS